MLAFGLIIKFCDPVLKLIFRIKSGEFPLDVEDKELGTFCDLFRDLIF